MNTKRESLVLPFKAFYQKDSKILILGTFPSPKSREFGFYYGHPQNRFWKVLSALFHQPTPMTVQERKDFLIEHKIALWDTIHSCEIVGASDSSIKNPVPVNIKPVLEDSDIKQVFTTGRKATQMYDKYIYQETGIKTIYLPSPSPANYRMSFDTLLEKYKIILKYLDA